MSVLSEQNVVDLIRSGRAVTQADLCRATGLRSSTMCYMLKRLRKKGMIRSAGSRIAGPGKPGTLLQFVLPGTLLVLDIDGSQILLGLLDFAGNVLAKQRLTLRYESDPKEVLVRCDKAARQLIKRTKTRRRTLQALGISINAYVTDDGVVKYSTVLPWRDIPIRRLAEEHFHMPVFCSNSQHKAITEYRYGAGQGSEVMLYFHVGDGVSARPVIQGKLFSGVGMSGEIGHIVFRTDGPQCGCGQRGCLESLVSGPAICRRILKVAENSRSNKLGKLIRLAKRGQASSAVEELVRLTDSISPRRIKELLADVIELAGRGLAMAVACFGPDRIVVDGYVFRGRPEKIERLKEAAQVHFRPLGQAMPSLVSATVKEEDRLLSIVSWVADQLVHAKKLTG